MGHPLGYRGAGFRVRRRQDRARSARAAAGGGFADHGTVDRGSERPLLLFVLPSPYPSGLAAGAAKSGHQWAPVSASGIACEGESQAMPWSWTRWAPARDSAWVATA